MLREKQIATVAIICSMLGLAALFFLNTFIGPMPVNLQEIDHALIGETISTHGKVVWVLQRDNFLLFTLENGTKLKAIKFSPTILEKTIVKPGTIVKVSGKVELYKNEIEIVAGEIVRWTGS